MRIKILFIAAISIVFFAGHPLADSGLEYQTVKKEFQRLRNTDSHVRRQAEWLASIEQLKNFYEQLPPEQSAESMFLAAQGYATLWKEKKEKRYFNAASDALETVVRRRGQTTRAPASLHELYKLYEPVDEDAAEEYLEQLLKEYPKSEYAAFAAEKLKSGQDAKKNKPVSVGKGAGFTVVIDPGHGGEDLGAVGVGGIFEKDVVLDMAYSIKNALEERGIARVLLTRTNDRFVPLQERTEFANNNNADIFISLHCNASEKKNLSGFESFVLDEQGDAAALKLAQRENASSEDGTDAQVPDDVAMMLSELIQSTKKPESLALANMITQGVRQQLLSDNEFKRLPIRKPRNAPFYVLVGAHMPAVLVELSYVDNEMDGVLLASPVYRKVLGEGIAQSIQIYRDKNVR